MSPEDPASRWSLVLWLYCIRLPDDEDTIAVLVLALTALTAPAYQGAARVPPRYGWDP
jgi:hypothetical protein